MATDARATILDAAFRLFVENGYEATSLARILAEVPYSKGALYHHFESKEALLEAVIDRFFTASLTEPAHPRPTEPRALTHRLIDDYVSAIEAIAQVAPPLAYYAFLISVAPRVQPALQAAQTHVHDELAASLASALPDERVADAQALASDIIALIEGTGLLDVVQQRVPDRAHLRARTDDLLRVHRAVRHDSAENSGGMGP